VGHERSISVISRYLLAIFQVVDEGGMYQQDDCDVRQMDECWSQCVLADD
jgi:hypothetical protein